MEWDDPQIHTVEEFLTDERDALIDLLAQLNKNPDIDNAEQVTKILHVIDYLNERLAGKYQ
jgi:hypothetical protein|tara:strand:+ start:273 stop:455 length:183 start_codon:yes stop_codon:yes gene_type:complete